MGSAAAVAAWRFGLGWVLGRRWLLLTTQTERDEARHSLHRFRFHAGVLYIGQEGGPWEGDLAVTPRAMTQTHPGPLAVRARTLQPAEVAVFGDDRWVALEPTTEPTVGMVEPDLLWVWPLLAITVAGVWFRRIRRRGREQRPALLR